MPPEEVFEKAEIYKNERIPEIIAAQNHKLFLSAVFTRAHRIFEKLDNIKLSVS